MKKMTVWEKTLESVALILIIVSIIIKAFIGTIDTGIMVMCSFLAVMLYVIFLVCTYFPVDWRMTENQKIKVENMSIYQIKYRKIFVVINFLLSIMSSSVIIFIC